VEAVSHSAFDAADYKERTGYPFRWSITGRGRPVPTAGAKIGIFPKRQDSKQREAQANRAGGRNGTERAA